MLVAARRRPLVSVVMPCKDVEYYVADALTSLKKQFSEPRDLEIVAVNDGSTDATADVLASFSPCFPNFEILSNSTPTGLATARNQGLGAMSGRFVAYLDADDWLAPTHLSKLANLMSELRVNFLRTDHTTVFGFARQLKRAPEARRGVSLDPRSSILPVDSRTMVDYPYAWAGLYDRTLAEDGLLTFSDGLHTAEDRPWIWKLFLRARTYAVVDSPGILYRRGLAGSLTSISDRRQLDILPALRQSFEIVQTDPEVELYLPKLTRLSLALIVHHVAGGTKMETSVRRELLHDAAEFLASIPLDVLERELSSMDTERGQILRGLMPAYTAQPYISRDRDSK